MAPEICPVCGSEVPPNARACPECGSDEETGWSERARGQDLGLPDDKFDYDAFIKEEFREEESKLRPRGVLWIWWIVALVLVALLVWFLRR